MRTYPFALAALLALAVAFPSLAAEKPRSAQTNQNQSKKIWTNEDMDQLHSRGLISIVGPEVAEVAAPSAPAAIAPPETPEPVYKSKLEDPAWYAQKSADLQKELDERQAALDQQQTALANAARGITQPGVSMDQPSVGVTPESGLDILTAQVQEVQDQLDGLSDLARQNSIAPGVLRN
ncbi:MAG TPA: hypothetical protein VGI34_04490 [Candidatus Acidoferrales bacterium]